MHPVAPGVSIHTPAGTFDHLPAHQTSPNVQATTPSVIDKINSDLRDINECAAAAYEGMNDREQPDTVRAHFRRLHRSFCEARNNLLEVRAGWERTAGGKEAVAEVRQEQGTRHLDRNFSWTKENEALLRRLYVEEGTGPVEIGRRLGCSRHKVSGKLHRMKLVHLRGSGRAGRAQAA